MKKRIYITEGPFDSLLIPKTALAMAGADISLSGHFDGKDVVYTSYDNEPRNAEITKRMSKAYRVKDTHCRNMA